RGGAINFFRKPFKIEEVIEVVSNAVKHYTSFSYHELASPDFLHESKAFSLKVGRANLLPIVNQIVFNCGALFSEAEIINIKIGIEEMITNAIEHGSLGIGYETKRQALVDGNFYELCRKRLTDPANLSKNVSISSTLTQDKLVVEVSDSGPGFDWKNLPSVTSENIHTFNGRGILLTRIFFDQVDYNQAGNKVTLQKFKNSQSFI
ncbi:MAG: ATP-binding protein, partial [Spirochaetaceae bacterium]